MVDGLKPYPSYRESGIPWPGRIPTGWEVHRNGYLFAERRETGFPDLPILEVSLRTGVRVRDLDAPGRKQVMDERVSYKRAQRRDIAYNMMRMWQGAVGVVPLDGLVSPAYVVARPRAATVPEYFVHLFRIPAYMRLVEESSRGIVADRNRLYWDQFKQLASPVPPPDEQEAIARFLAHVERLVERFVRAKRQLIALLQEEKRVIIDRALTRGLDPGARLRPSGIGWTGSIPEGWALRRFKYVARIASGQIDPRASSQKSRVLIAPNHIKSGTGRIVAFETAEQQGADSGKYEVRKGQIVYSKIRPALRKAAIAPVDCLCSADMYPISVVETELRPQYLLLLLLSRPFTEYVVDCSLRVAMPKVNREALGNAWMMYPGLAEQDAIIRYVNREAEPRDGVIRRIEREIGLVRDFVVSLTSHVVTGQLDVRHAASNLPHHSPWDVNESGGGRSAGEFFRDEDEPSDVDSVDSAVEIEA